MLELTRGARYRARVRVARELARFASDDAIRALLRVASWTGIQIRRLESGDLDVTATWGGAQHARLPLTDRVTVISLERIDP
jgi:hypothetical protein